MFFQKILEIPILILIGSLLLGCTGLKPKEEKSSKPVETKTEQIIEERLATEPSSKVQATKPTTTPIPSHSPPPEPSKTLSPPSITQSPERSLEPPVSYRSARIVWSYVNLREGPGMNYKVVGTAKKGTSVTILEEKGNWFRIRLENGKEAWMSKAATSQALPPPPSLKPKPM